MNQPIEQFQSVLNDLIHLEEERDTLKETFHASGASLEEELRKLRSDFNPTIKALDLEIKNRRKELIIIWKKNPDAFKEIQEGRSLKFDDYMVTLRMGKNIEPKEGKEFELIKALYESGWLEESARIELDEKIIERLIEKKIIDSSLVQIEEVVIPAIRKKT